MLDIESKEIVWNFETNEGLLFTAPYVGKGSKTVESSPTLEDKSLIFGANDGYVYFVDIHTGKLINKKQAGSAVLGKTSLADGKIYAGTFDGYVVCYKK